MNIKEKINYYSSQMSLNFFIKSYIKLDLLEKDIGRYLKREFKGNTNLQFESQDLRSLVIALEKTHKAFNKKISFQTFRKTLEKYKKVDGDIINKETQHFAHSVACVINCQRLLALFNYHATATYLIELKHQQEKEASDEIFNHEILSGLLEIF